MTTAEAVQAMLESSGKGPDEASREMHRDKEFLRNAMMQAQFAHRNLAVSTLASSAKVCGYSLALVPEDEVTDEMIIVESSTAHKK